MKQIVIFSALLLFIVTSCKKPDDVIQSGTTSIKNGRVIDSHTGNPIAYATVWLVKQDPNIIGALGYSSVSSTLSDSNGYFNIDFTRDKGYRYYLAAESKPYYGQTDYQEISTGNNVIKMYADGWIKFNVINEPPLDTIYEFSLGIPGKTINILSKDTIIFKESNGYQNADIVYSYNKNNKQIHIVDHNIYVSGLDTVEYKIKF